MRIQLSILSLLIVQTYVLWSNDSFVPISFGETVKHNYFILSYNEDTEQANWVYYTLNKSMLIGEAERTNFRMDPKVSTESASVKDYTNSGYDRGHLCPAADMKFDETAMYETFYMSNMSPQVPAFNRGIWKSLEEQTRTWVNEKDSLIVVVGPVFLQPQTTIGNNKVVVPTHFYKILFDVDKEKMITFFMANEGSTQTLNSFVTSVDSIEELTGIDFFSQLPDNLENKLEREINVHDWFDVPEPMPVTKKAPLSPVVVFLVIIIVVLLFVFVLKQRK